MSEQDETRLQKDDFSSSKENKENKKDIAEDGSEIIELSDIAIGTTPDDEAIIELTEEVINEAMNGISGATSDTFKDGEKILDLSTDKFETETPLENIEQVSDEKAGGIESHDLSGSLSVKPEEDEDHISKELDEFFGSEEESGAEKPSFEYSASNLRDEVQGEGASIIESDLVKAIEITIRKVYGDRINKLIAESIERIVAGEIKRVKEFLSTKAKK